MIRLRDEALLLLDGKGSLMEVAREVSQIMRAAMGSAPVIGGIAVVLHGYVRTTIDINLFTNDPKAVSASMKASGFEYHKARREFIRDGIPVHLVTPNETRFEPQKTIEIDGVETVTLADLIAMKLRSGLKNRLRAIDLADVIGLIRARRLKTTFASQIPKDLRTDFRNLVRAIEAESDRKT